MGKRYASRIKVYLAMALGIAAVLGVILLGQTIDSVMHVAALDYGYLDCVKLDRFWWCWASRKSDNA
jgi:hypothetical protein